MSTTNRNYFIVLLTVILVVALEAFARYRANPITTLFLPCVFFNLTVYALHLFLYSQFKNTFWAVLIIVAPAAITLAALKRARRQSRSAPTPLTDEELPDHRRKLIVAGLGGLLTSLLAITAGLRILLEFIRYNEEEVVLFRWGAQLISTYQAASLVVLLAGVAGLVWLRRRDDSEGVVKAKA